MVLATHLDPDLIEPTIALDEDVPPTSRLSEEEAEAVLDAYSAAVVAVADRVGPLSSTSRSRKTSRPKGSADSASTPCPGVDQASSSRRTGTSSPTATSSTTRRIWK